MEILTGRGFKKVAEYAKENDGLLKLIDDNLESIYFDDFNFYFSKPINELISNSRTPHAILFRDYQFYDLEETSMRRWYTEEESYIRLQNYTAFFAEIDKKYYPTTCISEQRKIMNKRLYKIHKLKRMKEEGRSEHGAPVNPFTDQVLKNLDHDSHFMLQLSEQMQSTVIENLKSRRHSFEDNLSYETKLHDIYYPSFTSKTCRSIASSAAKSLREMFSGLYSRNSSFQSNVPSEGVSLESLVEPDSFCNGRKFEMSPIRCYNMIHLDEEGSSSKAKFKHTVDNFTMLSKKKYSESSETRDKRSGNKKDSQSESVNQLQLMNFTKKYSPGQLIKEIKSPSINISDLLTKSQKLLKTPKEIRSRNKITLATKVNSKIGGQVPLLELAKVRKCSDQFELGKIPKSSGRRTNKSTTRVSKIKKKKKLNTESKRSVKTGRSKKRLIKQKMRSTIDPKKISLILPQKSSGSNTFRRSSKPAEPLNSYIRAILRKQGAFASGNHNENTNHLFNLKIKQKHNTNSREKEAPETPLLAEKKTGSLIKHRSKFMKSTTKRLSSIKKKFDKSDFVAIPVKYNYNRRSLVKERSISRQRGLGRNEGYFEFTSTRGKQNTQLLTPRDVQIHSSRQTKRTTSSRPSTHRNSAQKRPLKSLSKRLQKYKSSVLEEYNMMSGGDIRTSTDNHPCGKKHSSPLVHDESSNRKLKKSPKRNFSKKMSSGSMVYSSMPTFKFKDLKLAKKNAISFKNLRGKSFKYC